MSFIIQCRNPRDLEDGSDLQMVLKISANPVKLMRNLQAMLCKLITGSDAGKLKNLRSADCACTQNKLPLDLCQISLPVLAECNARNPASVTLNPLSMGLCCDCQIGPSLSWFQKGRGCAHTPA